MLFFGCSFLIGSYFCYDNPGAISDTLEKDLGLSAGQYGLLYSVYSYPNMVLPIFGGILLDMIGLRFGIMLFSLILTLGQAIFTMGGYYRSYPLMLVGRVVFGLGGESLSVSQSAIVSKWFKGKELAMALGFNLSISRLGSTVNGIVLPEIYNKEHTNMLGFALLVGFFVCVFSLICAVCLSILDKKADDSEKNATGNTVNNKIMTEEDKFRWSDIRTFNLSFWIICMSCVLTYTAIFPFIQVASKMLQERFGFSDIDAGALFTLPYTISAFTSPFLGILIDKIGRRGLLIIMSAIILFAAHVTNMFLPNCSAGEDCYSELGPLILIGIGYSIYAAALWGSIPYVVEARTVGTAFGFCTAIQNTGMAIAPSIVGAIIDATKDDSSHGYFWVSVFFALICVVTLALNCVLYYVDIKHNGGTLNKVHKGDNITQLMGSPLPAERPELNSSD